MIVLDENVPENQRQLLRAWKIRLRQIGVELGRKGISDERILPLLCRLSRPTFFTRDDDFFARELCHPRYCLVVLNVRQNEIATFVRRFLRHRKFANSGARMGRVVSASHAVLRAWRHHEMNLEEISWT